MHGLIALLLLLLLFLLCALYVSGQTEIKMLKSCLTHTSHPAGAPRRTRAPRYLWKITQTWRRSFGVEAHLTICRPRDVGSACYGVNGHSPSCLRPSIVHWGQWSARTSPVISISLFLSFPVSLLSLFPPPTQSLVIVCLCQRRYICTFSLIAVFRKIIMLSSSSFRLWD